MNQIDRIARNIGWTPTDWQRTLCKTVPPLAVYGIFRNADYTPQRRIMVFPHTDQLQRARAFEKGVSDSLGAVAMVSAEAE